MSTSMYSIPEETLTRRPATKAQSTHTFRLSGPGDEEKEPENYLTDWVSKGFEEDLEDWLSRVIRRFPLVFGTSAVWGSVAPPSR